MRSISFTIRFLTWILIVGLLIVVFSKIWREVIFLQSITNLKLLGVTFPPQLDITIFKCLIVLYCLSMIFIIYHLNNFQKVMTDFYNDLLFTKRNGLQLRRVSKGILYFAIFIAVYKIILGFYSDASLGTHNPQIRELSSGPLGRLGFLLGYQIGVSITLFFPFLIISQVILLFSEMINKGYLIKSENDLTI
jgi:hypothetical protein